MNTETKEKLLRVLGWDEYGLADINRWHLGMRQGFLSTDQALAHAESMKAALEFMLVSGSEWCFCPLGKFWMKLSGAQGSVTTEFMAKGNTQQEAILAGVVAWCELNDGWEK